MSQKNIQVLIVDDSVLIRELMQDILNEIPGIEVAATAADGREALKIIGSAKIDVVTLDVQMPGMNGIETLEKILTNRPLPVIMVSATTQLGASTTLQALELGAMDYIAKPEGLAEAQTTLKTELGKKIRSVYGADLEKVLELRRKRAEKRKIKKENAEKTAAASFGSRTKLASKQTEPIEKQSSVPGINFDNKCIAIGISTGGPPALTTLFESLPAKMPPIVIVQHMPANFTKSFASRLDLISELSVKEAETGDILKPNHAYVAPGGKHLRLLPATNGAGKLEVFDDEPVCGHRPSADVMMTSAARVYQQNCLGVIMTGMGSDGSDGCKAIQASRGFVLGQDEESSDVYGMNKVAFSNGHVDKQFSLDRAAITILKQMKRQWGPARVK